VRGGTVTDLLADPGGWTTWVQRAEVAPKFERQKPGVIRGQGRAGDRFTERSIQMRLAAGSIRCRH
jgi:hypothetical protein